MIKAEAMHEAIMTFKPITYMSFNLGSDADVVRWTPLAGQVRGQIKIVDCPYRPQC